MTDIEHKVLSHIGRYQITIKPAVARVFFLDKDPSHVLNSLRDSGLIAPQELPVPDGRSYYQLTTEGARHMQVSPERAKPIGPAELQQLFATLWFCLLDNKRQRRALLNQEHLKKLLPGVFGTSDRVAVHQNNRDGNIFPVYNILHFTTAGREDFWLEKLRAMLSVLREHPKTAPMVRDNLLRHILLVRRREEAAAFKRAVRRSDDFHYLDWGQRIFAKPVPDPATLTQFDK